MTIWRPLSAYQILQPAERAFCDAIVRHMETEAQANGHPIAVFINNGFEVPPHIATRDSKGMMTRERVKNAVWERLNELATASDLTEYRWVKETMSIATSNMQNYFEFDEDGNPIGHRFDRCTPEMWAAVKTIEIDMPLQTQDDAEVYLSGKANRAKIKLQLHDKMTALKMIGEYAGFQGMENPRMRADKAGAGNNIRADDTTEQAGERYAALLESK